MSPKIIYVSPHPRTALHDVRAYAFENLGIGVLYYHQQSWGHHDWELGLVGRGLRQALQEIQAPLDCFNIRSLSITQRPLFVFIDKGLAISAKTVKLITEAGIPVFHWWSDDPCNPLQTSRRLREAIPYYTCHFSPRCHNVADLKNMGAEEIRYLPFGYDPRVDFPADLTHNERDAFASDVAFIGRYEEDRARYLTSVLDFVPRIWGDVQWKAWANRVGYKPSKPITFLPRQDMRKAVGAAKIVLCFLSKLNKDQSTCRTFEITACGGFMMAERTEEHQNLFVENQEAVFFNSPEELRDKLSYYLKHDQKRQTIAKAGYEKCIRSSYSTIDRMREVIEFANKCHP